MSDQPTLLNATQTSTSDVDVETAAFARLRRIHLEQTRLESELADAVRAARDANLSWTKIGEALDRPRQVVHQRFSPAAGAIRPLDLPGLSLAGGTAVHRIEAAAGLGYVDVTLVVRGSRRRLSVGGPGNNWSATDWDGRSLDKQEIEQVLGTVSAGLRDELVKAGEAAQQLAERRQAAIVKRLATIEERGSKIGRPRKKQL